ncbi:DUF1566 domain-containing protein [bacterium]|nr:DUF1566 domain-containing protein [bacterium]
MKHFFVCLAVLTAMFFFVACDGSKKITPNDADNVASTSEATDSDDPSTTNTDGDNSQSDTAVDTDQDSGSLADDLENDNIDTTDNDNSQNDADSTDSDNDFNSDDDSDTSSPDEDSHDTTRVTECTGLPENGEWNQVSAISQTWNGTEWVPGEASYYNEETSDSECRFICKNNYSWDGTSCLPDQKNAECSGKPENAVWNSVSSITQTWDGNEWIPSNIGSYNTSASNSECYFKCREHYTWNGSVCVADTQTASCTGLPTNAVWNSVSDITQTWNGSGWSPSNTGSYNNSASTTECRFKCKENYSWNTSSSTCKADTKVSKCTGLPANASWNTATSITQTWNGSDWTPGTAGTYNATASTTQCRFKCNEHYNWNSSSSTCKAETKTANCTGLPTNAVWNSVSEITQTWNGSTFIPATTGSYNTEASLSECRYKCSDSYHWENSACVSNTKTSGCTGLPTNAQWNTATSITQTWNGTSWTPTTTGTYNTTESSTECRYKCKEHYSWKNSQCVADTQTANCSGLPANSVWNTASSITQTWNGSSWNPSTTGSYNTTASTTECRYKCNSSSHRENSSCVSNTRTANCTGLPTGAVWNTASSITQTWNGSSWNPSTTGSYNTTASTTECRYKCGTNYTWDKTNLKCKANSKVSNCTGLPSNADWNTVSTISQTWNGSSWQPTTTASYNATASTAYCRFKCVQYFKWDGSKCVIDSDSQFVPVSRVCTGQTKCYNNSGTITCPTSSSADFFGQDAYYASLGYCAPQNFSLEGSNASRMVVVDNNTGLMWQQTTLHSATSPSKAEETYCSQYTYGGYSDWRLPTIPEILSIVDNGRNNPAANTTYFPDTSGYFWVAETYHDKITYTPAQYRDYAFRASLQTGKIIVCDMTNNTCSAKVMCVREQ